MSLDLLVVIKGAGEMASGVAWRLANAGFRVLMTERAEPLAVRRGTSYCEAVLQGRYTVEGREAVLILGPEQALPTWRSGRLPVLVDPDLRCLEALRPQVLVEATVSKHNTGLRPDLAPLVIALGPGYLAGVDCHYVVETNRGHDLGRIIERGSAAPNTGIPGTIAGYNRERVLRAPVAGVFETPLPLGARVTAGQLVASVDGQPIRVEIAGALRGLLRSGVRVEAGCKVGDVDPRDNPEQAFTISDKARALGGAVLEAILRRFNRA